jgi:hypothetical protein
MIIVFRHLSSKAGHVTYHDRNVVNGAYSVEADVFHGGLAILVLREADDT